MREPEGERDGDGGGGAGVAADTEFILREAIKVKIKSFAKTTRRRRNWRSPPDDQLPSRRESGEAAGKKRNLPLQASRGDDGSAPAEAGRAPLALVDAALEAEGVSCKVDGEGG